MSDEKCSLDPQRDCLGLISASVLAGILSLLTSVAGLPEMQISKSTVVRDARARGFRKSEI